MRLLNVPPIVEPPQALKSISYTSYLSTKNPRTSNQENNMMDKSSLPGGSPW
jgi:hypothetical protein